MMSSSVTKLTTSDASLLWLHISPENKGISRMQQSVLAVVDCTHIHTYTHMNILRPVLDVREGEREVERERKC